MRVVRRGSQPGLPWSCVWGSHLGSEEVAGPAFEPLDSCAVACGWGTCCHQPGEAESSQGPSALLWWLHRPLNPEAPQPPLLWLRAELSPPRHWPTPDFPPQEVGEITSPGTRVQGPKRVPTPWGPASPRDSGMLSWQRPLPTGENPK